LGKMIEKFRDRKVTNRQDEQGCPANDCHSFSHFCHMNKSPRRIVCSQSLLGQITRVVRSVPELHLRK
jgi:hypothetical protein